MTKKKYKGASKQAIKADNEEILNTSEDISHVKPINAPTNGFNLCLFMSEQLRCATERKLCEHWASILTNEHVYSRQVRVHDLQHMGVRFAAL